MSAYTESLRTALYSKMNVSGVTNLATGGIYWKIAPANVTKPFVVFDLVPFEVVWAMNNANSGERQRWFIKAIADRDSSTTQDPSAVCETILAAIETAIGNTVTVSGRTVSRVQRVADIPPITEDVSDRQIWQHGFQLETFIS